MKKFIFLALASGFNRAGIFLLSPIIALFININDYGIFSLYLAFSTLLIIFISFNLSSIIAREVYEKLTAVLSYMKVIIMVIMLLLTINFLLLLITKTTFPAFVIFISAEAIFLINTTYIRYRKGDRYFLYNTLIKFVFIILFFYLYFKIFSSNSDNIVRDLFIIMSATNLISLIESRKFLLFSNIKLALKEIKKNIQFIYFALTLFPHVISQWILSGSDRYFVKLMYSPDELGSYSFAYSLASVFMLVNAALSLALPQIAVKDFTKYKSNRFIFQFCISTAILYVLFLSILKLITPLFVKYIDYPIFDYSVYILSGLYFLCYYTYFSAYLFYDRDTTFISLISICCAALTIPTLFLFSYFSGLKGVAFVTLLIYFIYSILITLKAAPSRSILLFIPISIVILMLVIF